MFIAVLSENMHKKVHCVLRKPELLPKKLLFWKNTKNRDCVRKGRFLNTVSEVKLLLRLKENRQLNKCQVRS